MSIIGQPAADGGAYTTHGLMTAADLEEWRLGMDPNDGWQGEPR